MPVQLEEADQEVVERVQKAYRSSEGFHREWCEKADMYYSRYRNFTQWRNQRANSNPRDRDIFWNDASRDWGAKLSIPFGFSTIETIVPRLLSESPRMLVLPRDQTAAENVKHMKALIDYQQDDIDFELILQDVAKDGLMTGLGVLKTFWRKEVRDEIKVQKAEIPMPGREWVQAKVPVTVFDGNDAEAVDPRNFFRDPFGHNMKTVEWVIHRTWRSDEYVRRKVASGAWRQDWPVDELVELGGIEKLNEVWASRMLAQGHKNYEPREGRIHEVWEFHNREQVITVLDRQVPVSIMENPTPRGEMPFHIYRPTRLNGEFAGVSELEPLQDLLDEMDTLRSQRRDNATLVLQKTFAYQEGVVDPSDLKLGPGVAIPVNGDPSQLLMPIQVGDIPNSSYQEEQALLGDIDRTSGISDAVSGGEGNSAGASATATGAQLVHSAANVRITGKTKLLEKETIRNSCRQWVRNNQRRIVTNREIPVPAPPPPGEDTPAWTWFDIGPGELMGEFEIVCEGGSTAPENIPQMRQDAQLKFQILLGNPQVAQNVDQRRALTSIMHDLGVEMPEAWLNPVPMIPLQEAQQQIQEAQQKQQQAENQAAQAMRRHTTPPSQSLSYKDAPPSIQRQMEEADGYTPASDQERQAHQEAMKPQSPQNGPQGGPPNGSGPSNGKGSRRPRSARG